MKLPASIGVALALAFTAGVAIFIERWSAVEIQGPPSALVQIANAFPDAVFFKETSERVVALTIDDVPGSDDNSGQATQLILDAVAAHNENIDTPDLRVTATFFVISGHLQDGTTILDRIAGEGHEIANHGEADSTAALLSGEAFAEQLQSSHDRLATFTNQRIRWYRPGRGFFTPEMVAVLRQFPGYESRFALASMLPVDTFRPSDDPRFTAWYVSQHIFRGAILVLHGGTMQQSRQTAAALDLILPELGRRGYRVVSLSELWDHH